MNLGLRAKLISDQLAAHTLADSIKGARPTDSEENDRITEAGRRVDKILRKCQQDQNAYAVHFDD